MWGAWSCHRGVAEARELRVEVTGATTYHLQRQRLQQAREETQAGLSSPRPDFPCVPQPFLSQAVDSHSCRSLPPSASRLDSALVPSAAGLQPQPA